MRHPLPRKLARARGALLLLPFPALVLACAATEPVARPSTPAEQRYAPGAPSTNTLSVEARDRLLEAVPELRGKLRAWIEQGHSPGLAAAVVTPEGRLWSVGLGEAEPETGEPVTGHTLFRLGSITKAYTGLLLLWLRDRGALVLDEPVERWVPEVGQVLYPTRDSPRLTLRHLVSHSSGLPRVGRLEYTDPRREITEADLLAVLPGTRLEFAPGSRTSYSNLGMAVAGLVAARAAGRPLRAFLKEALLEPLEMGETAFDPAELPGQPVARGHALEDGVQAAGEPWRLGAAEAMGGLWTSLEDATRFAAFQLSAWPPRDEPERGPVRRASVRESHTHWGPLQERGPRFGVNWAVAGHPSQGLLVTHAGGTLLYSAVVWLLPDRGLGVVLLANSGGEHGELHEALASMASQLVSDLLRHLANPSPDLRL